MTITGHIRLWGGILTIGLLGLATFFWLTWPQHVSLAQLPNHAPDVKNGETLFFAGGCASCHAAPAGKTCHDPKYLGPTDLRGGRCLKTPFGTFYVPNITPDKATGIGQWTTAQFVTAMKNGVAPDGSHYYPAFPYTSYQRMTLADLIDLKAYLDTISPVRSKVPAHDLPLPFRYRRGLGLWKWAFMDGQTFVPDPALPAALNRGAYLVQGPGHCGECHTPRNLLGGLKTDLAYSGAKNPEGKGFIPNITPHKTGLKSWSGTDIAYALKTGFTPSFDSFGGSMVKVQENMARLRKEDRQAIAAYLKSLPPRLSSNKLP